MAIPAVLAQFFATDPRKLVRFPDLPLEAALTELQRVEAQRAEASAVASEAAPASAPAPAVEGLDAAISALATHVWRTRGKLLDPVTNEPKEETRRAYRHVEAALESFEQLGVKLNDWLDQPYDPGLPVKVLTFQPTEGLMRDTVVEVVKPTVIWRDRLLQLGEVIVGIPPSKTEKTL